MHNTDNSRDKSPRKPLSQRSGLAPAISQGTAATDNLSAMMRNTVVVFRPDIQLVNVPSHEQADAGTAVVRRESNRPVPRIQPITRKTTVEETFGAVQGEVTYHEDLDAPTTDEWTGS